MKRILTYVTMLTLAVACNDLYGPEETPLTPDKAGSIEISISDVTDNSFKVTVSPASESSYYAYLVDEAAAAVELDAAKLYEVKYSSVAQGNVKWTKENPSYTFEVAAKPNTTYQVYAVAGSPMGNPGDIAVKSVKTSDVVNPVFADYATAEDETSVQLLFSEDVAVAGDLTVRYFKRWTATNDIFNDQEAGCVTVPASDIAVSGKIAAATISGIPAGAYYTIAWGEGAFVDMAGNKVAAMESGFYTTEAGSLAPYGLYGRAPFEGFDVTPIEATSFAEYTDPFVTGFNTESVVVKGAEAAGAVATYVLGNKTVTIDLTYDADYGYAQGYCVVYLPEEPDRGAIVTITIPADSFIDEWGNGNNEFTHTAVYSYGYTLEDIVGTYAGPAISYWNGNTELSFSIAESDDPEKGNVMITGTYMGLPCSAGNIYADFDFHGGLLTIPDWQLFFQHPTAGDVYFALNGADYMTLYMGQSGVLSSPSVWFGAYIDGAGWYDIYTDCLLEKQAVEPEATATTTSVANMKVFEQTRVIR